MGSLTDLKIRTAAASGNDVLIADGDGPYLRIRSSSRTRVHMFPGLGQFPSAESLRPTS
jgi:hypothetical protein